MKTSDNPEGDARGDHEVEHVEQGFHLVRQVGASGGNGSRGEDVFPDTQKLLKQRLPLRPGRGV